MQQQGKNASTPWLSEADDAVLKLVLHALGEKHYLNASSVCRAWKEAYSTHVQQSPLTCCKPYLQDEALWSYIKELGLHDIPVALYGQYGCDSAVADKLAAALDKLKPQVVPEVTPEAASSATNKAEASGRERERSSSSDDEDDLNPMMPLIGSNAELHQTAVRRAEAAAAKHKAKKEAEHTAKVEAERAAKEAAERLVQLAGVCITETIVPIVTGAAKSGRYTVCANALNELSSKKTMYPYYKLLETMVRALVNTAAKCTDVTSFSCVLRALLIVTLCGLPVGSGADRTTTKLRCWEAAAERSKLCDAALPLQQFAAELAQNRERLGMYVNDGILSGRHGIWDLCYSGKALTWALVRNGVPVLHEYIIRTQQTISQDLAQKVAQKGRIDVLDCLLESSLLVDNDAIVRSFNIGAVAGDKVIVVKWLLAHGLLLDSIRQEVMPCHRKLIAYFAELDDAAAVAT
jgi:hypothetical protein